MLSNIKQKISNLINVSQCYLMNNRYLIDTNDCKVLKYTIDMLYIHTAIKFYPSALYSSNVSLCHCLKDKLGLFLISEDLLTKQALLYIRLIDF